MNTPLAIIASLGHAEYNLPDRPGLYVEPIWEPGDPDVEDAFDACQSDTDVADLWLGHTGLEPELIPGDADLGFETIAIVYGRAHIIAQGLDALIEDLAADPGGDDGTFDYWPSGVRFAQALDAALDGSRAGFIRQAVDTVCAMKDPDFTRELLDKCGYLV